MRCLVLFSGGLESLLAARLMQLQGIETIGVFFATLCARNHPPQDLADQLEMELIVAPQDESYCEAIRHPTLGRSKNAAACLNCRVQLLRRAEGMMHQHGAAFLVSGEVLGQRPRSQNRRDLDAVAYHAGVEDLLVRPLSAKLLSETRPERVKWIDREQLHAFHGNAHHGLIELARQLGLENLPASRPGCGLTDPAVSARVFDHLQHSPGNEPVGFELLSVGRHFRLDTSTKVVVGRNQSENERLAGYVAARPDAATIVRPLNFVGPTALILGCDTLDARTTAAALVQRFGKSNDEPAMVELQNADVSTEMAVHRDDRAATAVALGTK